MPDVDQSWLPRTGIVDFLDRATDAGDEEALEAERLSKLREIEQQLRTVTEILTLSRTAVGAGAGRARWLLVAIHESLARRAGASVLCLLGTGRWPERKCDAADQGRYAVGDVATEDIFRYRVNCWRKFFGRIVRVFDASGHVHDVTSYGVEGTERLADRYQWVDLLDRRHNFDVVRRMRNCLGVSAIQRTSSRSVVPRLCPSSNRWQILRLLKPVAAVTWSSGDTTLQSINSQKEINMGYTPDLSPFSLSDS